MITIIESIFKDHSNNFQLSNEAKGDVILRYVCRNQKDIDETIEMLKFREMEYRILD